MIREIFKLKFKFPKNSKIQSDLIRAFGPEIVEANVGTIMIAVQCLKAIEKGDSNAFNALLNQAYGPKFEVGFPQKMIVEVVHDDRELREAKKNKQYVPVGAA